LTLLRFYVLVSFCQAARGKFNVVSDGERVERMICDWLEQNYPGGPTWYGQSATETPPLEIKMIPAFGAIEYNISNGGWAQFLWNCFDESREVLDVAKDGYLLIGAPEQSAALAELRTLCERDKHECREALQQPVWLFAELTARSYSAPPNAWEHLFCDTSIYEKRLAWLAANEGRLRKALGELD
jgi:hypothetical protein